jgi:hypothetical protein
MRRKSGWKYWIATVVLALVLVGLLMALDHFLRSV